MSWLKISSPVFSRRRRLCAYPGAAKGTGNPGGRLVVGAFLGLVGLSRGHPGIANAVAGVVKTVNGVLQFMAEFIKGIVSIVANIIKGRLGGAWNVRSKWSPTWTPAPARS